MLTIKNKNLLNKAKRIRWFGINREGKQKGTWENDVKEVGYKYQMTDIAATLGYDSLMEFKKIISHRRKIFNIYLKELSKNKKIHCVNDDDKRKFHAAWLFTIVLDDKDYLQKKFRLHSMRLVVIVIQVLMTWLLFFQLEKLITQK